MKRVKNYLLLFALLVAGFSLGFFTGQLSGLPKVETVNQYVELPRKIEIVEVFTEVIKEVEVPVEVVKEVEVLKEIEIVKEVPLKLREFESVEALEEWYNLNEPPVVLYADEKGMINFKNPKPDSRFDCDDYATYLRDKALAQGYLMSLQLVEDETHMINMAMIGNEIYYLEPNPMSFEIWQVAKRD